MAQSSSPVEDVEQDKKAAAEQVQHPRKSERRYRFGPHRHRWLSWPRWWREALLVLLLVTAVLCLINPSQRWPSRGPRPPVHLNHYRFHPHRTRGWLLFGGRFPGVGRP
ncbi:MAG: hypothetical protein H6657_07650 [Ardenticatenaceae bacterium]|nr:hypothetical protein [Ardenticatenaceae bacterium]